MESYQGPPLLGGATVLGVAFARTAAGAVTELPRTGGVALFKVGAALVAAGSVITIAAKRGRGSAAHAGLPFED